MTYQTVVGAKSKLSFLAPGYTFPTITFGSSTNAISFGGTGGSGTTGSSSVTFTYTNDVNLSRGGRKMGVQVALNDPSFSYCGFNMMDFEPVYTYGSSSLSDSVSVPDSDFPAGVVVSQSVLGGLLTSWVVAGGAAPVFYVQYNVFYADSTGGSQNVSASASISNVSAGPNQGLSFIVATTNGTAAACSDQVLGGDGSFSFQACIINLHCSGLSVGTTYLANIPVATRAHGTTNAFVPAGSLMAYFTATETAMVVPVEMGFAGWGVDMQTTGTFTLTPV